ncbi:hypothetical protein [Nonlabens marinus]|uniref:Uncharacterized protein n=1 Tax=Nonlabens marinus S1-08 TaxID=1454201 RepID=W8VQ10_9FLAO|nr:hypothetical protein [Nonlabens marinus]BAO54775.1 hypothetical protein NMS_0766 [Nonlabens marinus S1-08]
MSPKIKVFVIYALSFFIVFAVTWLITDYFVAKESIWTTFIPIGAAMILAPKPHIEETQSGRQYGLKSIFSKKIFPVN